MNAGDKKKAVSAAKRQDDRKTAHVRGKNASVQAEAKTERKKSLCPHFKTCGGCQYLDMPYEKQLEHKKKEVSDLHQRTKEGIQTARMNGKQIGQKAGVKLITKKSVASKEIILKHSKDFGGSLSDMEMMQLTGLARNTYYKYKRELKQKG